MTHLARVASLIFNTPLLVTPDVACTIANALAERWGVDPLEPFDASRFVGQPSGPRDANGEMRTMYRAEKGIALIGVMGELVNRGAWVGASSGLTSYEGLDAQLAAAERDDAVKGVVLDINSPGGQAAGAMETAAKIRALDAKKPVVAFVNGMAASAAYALASGARTIVATPSAMLGSIGVVWMHVDRSAQAEKAGVKPTLLTAGAFKTDGHPLAPLAADARQRIQAQIDKVYDLFVQTVAAHRPIDAAAVRATEAGVYIGSQAVEAGLADLTGSLEDAFQAVRAALPKSQFSGSFFAASKESNMTDAFTKAQLDAAVAEAKAAGAAEAKPTFVKEAAEAERARIGAILDATSAKGREAQARHFAFKTAMSVAEASAALEAAPAGQEGSPLVRAMESLDQPKLGAGAPADGRAAPRAVDTAGIYAARAKASTGR
jgi:signal peptide peptidase SppA